MEDELRRRRFLWGVVLAWVPWVPAIVGLGHAFVGIANTKATGLAAVAGGLVETQVMVGLAATLTCEVSATVLLFRAFSRGHELRSVVSVFSICMSGLLALLFGLSVWFFWFANHHTY
jgi:hypothetical protein